MLARSDKCERMKKLRSFESRRDLRCGVVSPTGVATLSSPLSRLIPRPSPSLSAYMQARRSDLVLAWGVVHAIATCTGEAPALSDDGGT